MSNAKFAKKLKAYYEFWKADKADVKAKERDTLDGVIKQMRVITLTISELRKANLRKTAQEVSPDVKGLFWFICEKAYLGKPAGDPEGYLADVEGRYAHTSLPQ